MILETFPSGAPQSRSLTLFFAGWGMDARPFLPYLPEDRDTIVCYDYSDPSLPAGTAERLNENYDDILLVAWSMGVWAAARARAGTELRCRHAIAVNGTAFPVDAEWGIPPETFDGTILNLTPESLRKFRRRMFISAEEYEIFSFSLPERDFAGVERELRAIRESARAEAPPPPLRWDCAIISSRDRIFPPDNQRRAWAGTRTLELPCGHFPGTWRSILDGTAPGETLNGAPDGD